MAESVGSRLRKIGGGYDIKELLQSTTMNGGTVYYVGDSAGWNGGNVDYRMWASAKTFHVGDTIAKKTMKVHPVPMTLGLSPSNASVCWRKKLRQLPRIFAKVLELPFHSDSDVSILETPDSLRFCYEHKC
ncbi:Stellacyanin [Capsicum baccatum]|uniref:Stellacyanin n=1 Tax=Capsicum baccatum TaxID=33114 RepID=A0A2G2VVY9_CAPBA|nr:Stellacyanin [Capsicum baccatum]